MRKQSLSLVLLMFGMSLAGCIGDDAPTPAAADDAAPASSEDASNATMDVNETVGGAAPVANLTVAGGPTPASLNFTINATDEDGDLASWTLDLGDGNATNGTDFPATVSHEFAAGTFNVTLMVEDATGLNATAVVSIEIVAQESAPEPVVLVGSVEYPCTQCSEAGTDFCAGRQAADNGVDCVWFPIEADWNGRAFVVTSSGGDPDLRFYGSCISGTRGASWTANGQEAGVIPDDTGCVMIWEYEALGSEITMTIA